MNKEYVLITGTFHVTGTSPDGDSVRFRADDKSNWGKLKGPNVRLNRDEEAQLRFEGVDALETHYRAGKTVSQPKELANAATDSMLSQIGIADPVWTPTRSRIKSTGTDGTAGYILAKMTERYRRPIAFVFPGHPPRRNGDGGIIELTEAHLKKSVNYKLMEQGLVYPTYYKTLHWELRDSLTEVALRSKKKNAGVWKDDATTRLTLTDPKKITDDVPILPKLFRRLTRMYANKGSFENLNEYLTTRRETVVQISHCHFSYFDVFCRQKGKIISMDVPPEDLVFTS